MQETFLKYLQFEKRYSVHTIKSYRNDLSQFSAFLLSDFEVHSLQEANHAMVRSWMVSLVDQGLDSRSVNRKTACLRSFYKFLLKQEVISVDPMRKVMALKTSKKLPQFLNENTINHLLDNAVFEDTFTGWRDKLILELLYSTGTRLSEIINLKENNINLVNNTIKVIGKRNKERIIPLSKSMMAVIDGYKNSKKRSISKNDDEFLIVTETGDQCYPMLIYRTVKKYLNLFTTIEKRSPHVLRHTFATHLLNKGAELNAVKDLLGHSSLAATQVYTHNSMDKLKSAFDQAHPKA
ncbi:MAG: tyrosine-type recombinase/integrase [Bacteroidota bacterium]